METKILDECEMEIRLNEEFVVSRSEFDEFQEKFQQLIDQYRI